ncbi:MAG: MBL fold metallo-hydrolase [Solirubrobacterales bacterium]|nr:MBL fold metallo-hydrolase [Solirubrobacterales bacterium]
MRERAPGVHQLVSFPPNAINSYLLGDVLVDSGTRLDRPLLMRQLGNRKLSAHALTHAHGDHQGSSHAVCERFECPFWVGAADVEDAEAGGRAVYAKMPQPLHQVPRLYSYMFPGPGHPVARQLREGDTVADFTVLETPGHSAGHIAFWRESDRVLIAGDVFTNMNVMTLMPGLHEPLDIFTPDPARNRESMRRLAALKPRLTCFGHGAPLRDPERLQAFTEALESR